MPDIKQTLVFFEGDDDKAFLEKLLEAGLLPAGWQLANRDKNQHPGKDGLIRQLLPVISPVDGIGGRAVVFVDLDEMTAIQRLAWFRAQLTDALKDQKYANVVLADGATQGRIQSYRLASGTLVGHAVAVPVGQPDDADLNTKYQIDRFAIDDWVFRLALNQRVFERLAELQGIRFETAMKKYLEVADLFRANALEVRKAKTYIQILRALAAIGPSTATIVGRLVKKGFEALGKEQFVALMKPFLDDLTAAAGILSAPDASNSTQP